MKLPILLAVAVFVLAFTSSAFAGATTITEHWKNETFQETDVDCLGAAATIDITSSGVFHLTLTDKGGEHATFTEQGTFVLTSANGTFTGHFAIWGGWNANKKTEGGTFTFNAVGKSATGEQIRFHGVEHVNVTPAGVERSFGKFSCTQG